MNFKKTAATVLALQLVFAQAAAATLEDINAEISNGTNAVITGRVNQTDERVQEVLVKILMPGYTDNAVTAGNILNSVLAVESIAVDSENKFETTIGIPTSGRIAPEGRYYVYFSGEGITPPSEPEELWYIKSTTQDNVISYIKNTAVSADDVKAKLFDNLSMVDYSNADMLGIKNDLYEGVKAEVGEAELNSAIATVLYNDRSQLTDRASFDNIITLAIVMKAFDTNNADVMLDAQSKKFKEVIFAESDTIAALTLYNEHITASGKDAFISALSNNGYVSAAETSKTDVFSKAFVKQAVYNAVFSYMIDGVAQLGYEHIPNVLTTYGTDVYINVSAFAAKNTETQLSLAYSISISGVTTPDTLDAKIYELLNPVVQPSDNSPSGGYYGGSGVQGGEYINNLKEESDEREQEALNGFTDLENHLWAKEAIEYLSDKNIIAGTSSTTFDPERGIKRCEFAKILVLAFGIDLSDRKSEFTDVFDTAWYTPYVMALKENGLTEGDGNGYFNPEVSITREEVCTFIYRAIGDKLEQGKETMFVDKAEISDYAQDAVSALAGAGIINGYENGTFLPKNTTTRAEAAVIFHRLLEGGLA